MCDSHAALVTGATGRVGGVIARRLETDGFRVLRAGRRDGDLSDAEATRALVARAAEELGGLDLVVHAAGEGFVAQPVEAVTEEDWDAAFGATAKGSFFLAQAAAPHLRAANGVIVNIADLAAFETWPAYVPHGISKSGVVHLTQSLARVLAPEVRVGGIAPGTVLLPDKWSDEDAERLRATTPLRRMGTPEDVSSTVLFILDSDFLTGETIIVDGGRHVRT